MSSKQKKKARTKKNTTTGIQTELKILEWRVRPQDVFDSLKEALSTAEVLGYPDFSREFILETDASLNGLGAILSQQGKDGEICVITYACCSLCPSKRSMCNYSSARLKLLALRWVVRGKFWYYLLAS